MTEPVIIFGALLMIVTIAILAVLYFTVRDAPPQGQQQSYRRHRPWNFK